MGLRLVVLGIFLLHVLRFDGEAAGRLSYDFYQQSCPQVENIVRTEVLAASFFDPTTPAALLRLLFHDCQVQGCDASILLEGPRKQSEMASPKSFGIRKRKMINLIKSALERVCPRQVSCADILVLAARDAVSLSGGPTINIPLGRRDSSAHPDSRAADSLLPGADIGLDATLQLFSKQGMTLQDTVAILGAHTLGVSHCLSLRSRFGNANETEGVKVMMRCGSAMGYIIPNDVTPVVFDNDYFVHAMRGRGVLKIDAAMPLDSRTRPFVHKFAADQNAFFRAFSLAFIKLSSSNVLTGTHGVIRRTCDRLD